MYCFKCILNRSCAMWSGVVVDNYKMYASFVTYGINNVRNIVRRKSGYILWNAN